MHSHAAQAARAVWFADARRRRIRCQDGTQQARIGKPEEVANTAPSYIDAGAANPAHGLAVSASQPAR